MSGATPGYPADEFVGRANELARVQEMFGRGERLITVLGPPGIGKTRLVLEYLRVLYGPGVRQRHFFSDLSEARDDGGVRAGVARALDATLESSLGAEANGLVRAMKGHGSLLLVLDNLEQVAATAAVSIADWLRVCPGLTILATSRERLRIAGEIALTLSPLGVPASDADARTNDSVTLFVRRARARVPEFTFTDDNGKALANLARTLGGNPLAIELAAARVGLMALDELEERLRDNLDVVARGYRDAAPRHASLRAAVKWSWDLLDVTEQSVLSRCSIFRGGFSLPAAESVLSDDENVNRVLDTLHSLVDKSMLRVESDEEEKPRFELYFGIREFAAEQQQARGGLDALGARHAAHFVEAAFTWSTDVERSGDSRARRCLLLERDNVLAAYDFTWKDGACARESLPRVLQCIVGLASIFVAHGPIDRLADITEAFFRREGAALVDAGLRARGLLARARALQLMGSLDAAERDVERAMALLEGHEDSWTLASILVDSGLLHHQRRHIERARTSYERALVIYEKLGSKRHEARLLGNIGALHHDLRDFEMAEAYYLRALRLLRRLDEARFEGNALANLGILTLEQGLHDDAAQYFERAESCLMRAGDRRLLGIARGNWGVLEHECGRPSSAARLFTLALDGLDESGDSASIGLCLARLGAVRAELELPAESKSDLERAERFVDRDEDPLTFTAIELYDAFRRLRSEASASRETVRTVRGRIQRARQPLRDDAGSAEDLSDDVRSALRLVERQLKKTEPLVQLLDALPDDALVVGKDCTWFRPPLGLSRNLSRNGAVRRVLAALVAAHGAPERASLDLWALRDAGWPEERMAPEAATNRVHVALAELRRKGLKACIVRSERGYALDPGLVVHVVDDEPER